MLLFLFQTWRKACVPPKLVYFSQSVCWSNERFHISQRSFHVCNSSRNLLFPWHMAAICRKSMKTFISVLLKHLLYCLFVCWSCCYSGFCAWHGSFRPQHRQHDFEEKALFSSRYIFHKKSLGSSQADQHWTASGSKIFVLAFLLLTDHAMERATWMGFPPNPAIAHSGSVCLSCCAEAVYSVFRRQIWWAINEYTICFLKHVLRTESWSCWCELMTHSQSYGSCLQCQERELFPSDYFLEYETEKIISKVLGIDRKH